MAEGWSQAPLPSVVWFQEGPGILAVDFHEQGVPLIRLAGLGGHEVSLNKCNYLDPAKVERRWKHFRVDRGDILVSTSASFGRPAVVGSVAEGAIPYTGIIRFRSASPDLDQGYLKAFLRSAGFMQQAEAAASGSVISHFGPSHLKRMEIPLPPLAVQRWIAGFHQTIDDKIELNRRMNETLEAMAQAIFRDWFVDFGPARRKTEGATDPVAIIGGLTPDPARAAELAGLFPATLGENGLPEGWREQPLDQIADFLNGLALQKYPSVVGEPSLPVIKIAELRNGLTDKSNRASPQLPPKYIVRDGDYLFSWSGSLMAKVWTEGDGALNQHLFKVTSNDYPQWFYAAWVERHLPEFQRIAASKATTMGHIQRGHLSGAMTVCPPMTTIEAMSSVLAPLWERRIHNDLESRTLAETRDYLLPRLMSGAVRVGEAQAQDAAA